MKKLPIVLLLSSLFFIGCNNELDLTAPAKDIPVVYGVFSKLETDHYVRVEKAFIDEQIDAITLANDPANYNYDDLTVQIRRLSNGLTFDLERIDGNLEGLQREEGLFNTDPNVLYKLSDFGLAGGETLELIIDRGQGFDPVTASTKVINNIELKSPNPETSTVDIRPDRTYSVTYDPPNDAKIFDVFITFHYYEFQNGVRTAKEVVWNFAKNQVKDDNENFFKSESEGFGFFQTLNAEIQPVQGLTRKFRKYSIDIVGGGVALKDFIRLTQANTGITSSQEVPNYTNLSEGLGIFSSKFTLHIDSMDIKTESYEQIINNELTRDLAFE